MPADSSGPNRVPTGCPDPGDREIVAQYGSNGNRIPIKHYEGYHFVFCYTLQLIILGKDPSGKDIEAIPDQPVNLRLLLDLGWEVVNSIDYKDVDGDESSDVQWRKRIISSDGFSSILFLWMRGHHTGYVNENLPAGTPWKAPANTSMKDESVQRMQDALEEQRKFIETQQNALNEMTRQRVSGTLPSVPEHSSSAFTPSGRNVEMSTPGMTRIGQLSQPRASHLSGFQNPAATPLPPRFHQSSTPQQFGAPPSQRYNQQTNYIPQAAPPYQREAFFQQNAQAQQPSASSAQARQPSASSDQSWEKCPMFEKDTSQSVPIGQPVEQDSQGNQMQGDTNTNTANSAGGSNPPDVDRWGRPIDSLGFPLKSTNNEGLRDNRISNNHNVHRARNDPYRHNFMQQPTGQTAEVDMSKAINLLLRNVVNYTHGQGNGIRSSTVPKCELSLTGSIAGRLRGLRSYDQDLGRYLRQVVPDCGEELIEFLWFEVDQRHQLWRTMKRNQLWQISPMLADVPENLATISFANVEKIIGAIAAQAEKSAKSAADAMVAKWSSPGNRGHPWSWFVAYYLHVMLKFSVSDRGEIAKFRSEISMPKLKFKFIDEEMSQYLMDFLEFQIIRAGEAPLALETGVLNIRDNFLHFYKLDSSVIFNINDAVELFNLNHIDTDVNNLLAFLEQIRPVVASSKVTMNAPPTSVMSVYHRCGSDQPKNASLEIACCVGFYFGNCPDPCPHGYAHDLSAPPPRNLAQLAPRFAKKLGKPIPAIIQQQLSKVKVARFDRSNTDGYVYANNDTNSIPYEDIAAASQEQNVEQFICPVATPTPSVDDMEQMDLSRNIIVKKAFTAPGKERQCKYWQGIGYCPRLLSGLECSFLHDADERAKFLNEFCSCTNSWCAKNHDAQKRLRKDPVVEGTVTIQAKAARMIRFNEFEMEANLEIFCKNAITIGPDAFKRIKCKLSNVTSYDSNVVKSMIDSGGNGLVSFEGDLRVKHISETNKVMLEGSDGISEPYRSAWIYAPFYGRKTDEVAHSRLKPPHVESWIAVPAAVTPSAQSGFIIPMSWILHFSESNWSSPLQFRRQDPLSDTTNRFDIDIRWDEHDQLPYMGRSEVINFDLSKHVDKLMPWNYGWQPPQSKLIISDELDQKLASTIFSKTSSTSSTEMQDAPALKIVACRSKFTWPHTTA